MTSIFWFSGTGNSLYAAKKLAAALGGAQLVHMTGSSGPVGGKGDRVGFVFPSYYGNLPRLVRAYIEKLDILPETYIFAIVTGGGAMTGSIKALKALLEARSLKLSFGQGLYLKGNYVLKYNPADPAKMEKTFARADGRIAKYAAAISRDAVKIRAIPVTSNNLYKNTEALDAGFSASDACTGCGLCEKLCPVANITICDSGKPQWLHRCEHCMACISWCPARAIEYADITQARRRYTNPRIRAAELFRPAE